jgi:predicted nucleic acid-binding protein
VFIYHIESTSRLAEPASVVLHALAGGAFVGITSVVTLMEITVRPLQQGRPAVAEEYEVLLANYPNLVLAEIDRAIARQAAWLRARYRCRPADALQMATSLEHAATAFVTNDRELQRVTELRIVILEDFA